MPEKNIYKLPWKCNDNPQCFLEITRCCRVACPSCYQKNGFLGLQHKPLSLVKEEVDVFIRALNPSTICIVGGEPTEHPDLAEIISYIKTKGINPALFTHSFNLNKDNIQKFVASGLGAVYAHIDSQTGQYLKKGADESYMMQQRDELARLLRPHKGRVYGMVSAILSENNFTDAPAIQKWAYDNSDIIKYCVFTLDAYKDGRGKRKKALDVQSLFRSTWPNFRFNSYLAGIFEDEIRWGQAVAMVSGGRPKYFGPGTVARLDKLHRLLFKKYTTILRPGIFKILPRLFTTVVVRPHEQGSTDFCGGCPDQTIYWVKQKGGKYPLLIHSCLSQDFIRKGCSEEEHALSQKIKQAGQIDDKAVCAYHGRLYSRDLDIIQNWDEAVKYKVNSGAR